MKRALVAVHLPDLCLVDGNQTIPHLQLPQRAVVQGDRIHTEVAAASILAKVWRDRLIVRLDRRYPVITWRVIKATAALPIASLCKP
jgi:ribonuclease HII